jgi:hypothetical protein
MLQHKYHSTYDSLYNPDIWGTYRFSILTAVGLLPVLLRKEDEFRHDNSYHEQNKSIEK